MARKSHMLWGIVSVLVGSWFGYATVRNLLFFNWRSFANAEYLWLLASLFPFSALAVYFVWVGKNKLQRAGGKEVRKPRLRWGTLVLGFCMVFFALKGHFAPSPNALKPDNESEAQGMLFVTVALVGVGALLMALAFRPVKQKLSGEAPSINAA